MTDFRMNKNKPIGSKTLSTIAGLNVGRRPKPVLAPALVLAPKQAFEVTPDLSETEVVEVPVAEALGGMITQEEEESVGEDATETIDSEVEAAADGVVKTGITVPADGKKRTTILGEDEDNATESNQESK
jgi:hypothetical protein